MSDTATRWGEGGMRESDVPAMLTKMVKDYKSQWAAAAALGVDEPAFSRARRGRVPIKASILAALGVRTKQKGQTQHVAIGTDLVAAAEARLYPGRDAEQLTWPEQMQAVREAKAYLVSVGCWPEAQPVIRGKLKRNAA